MPSYGHLRSKSEHFYFLEILWSFYPTYNLRSKSLRAVLEQRTRTARKMARIKERGGGGEEKKETSFLPSPPPTPSFIFWLSFHFSRGKNRKSRYWASKVNILGGQPIKDRTRLHPVLLTNTTIT